MNVKTIEKISYNLLKKAALDLSKDYLALLNKAYVKETNSVAKANLKTMIDNAKIAKEESRSICQDPGIPFFYVTLSQSIEVNGDIRAVVARATEKATKDLLLRANVVHPLTSVNPGTNVGWGIPFVYYDYEPQADYIEITAVVRGGGSAAVTSFIEVPSIGDRMKAIKGGLLESVVNARWACPPFVIGLCIGGDKPLAIYVATKTLFRIPVGKSSPNPKIADMEHELLEAINSLGIGPMGLGGDITALALHIEALGCHTARPPVAVAFSCWPLRYSTAKIYSDNSIEYLTHPPVG